jgi:hypothetical protein
VLSLVPYRFPHYLNSYFLIEALFPDSSIPFFRISQTKSSQTAGTFVEASSLPCPARHKLIAHQKHQKRLSNPDDRPVTGTLPEQPQKPDMALQS